MKRIVLSAAALLIGGWALAQENAPLWMRDCAISPDGTLIAFTYKGDVYTVPVDGGRATQLTTNPAYDTTPVWSPDGKHIAFASDRLGSFDVFIVSREGGEPRRLTTHSGSETPVVFRDADHLLFSATIQPSAEDVRFPSSTFAQVYEVSTNGGRPKMISSMPMENISIRNDGKQWLYQDKKGYEDPWRKHHQSSIARDIWMMTPGKNPTYAKLTSFKGEDRNPVWAPDGESFYYLRSTCIAAVLEALRPNNSHTTTPIRYVSSASPETERYAMDLTEKSTH